MKLKPWLCTLGGVLLSLPVFGQAPPSKKNVPNFATVAPNIYRGAAPTTEGLKEIKALGIKTIIDLRIEKKGQKEEAAAATALGLQRIRIPMGAEAPNDKQVQLFLATLAASKKSPVFVHCQHGADRTGAMIGIYRATQQHWAFEPIYTEMRNYGFKPFLTALKNSVKQRTKS
jgi:tyrosine-protein phosphatase SIW14